MSSNDTILTMENITKTFGPVKALTDVNLSVDRGEIHLYPGRPPHIHRAPMVAQRGKRVK